MQLRVWSLNMTGVGAKDFFKTRKNFKPQGQNMWEVSNPNVNYGNKFHTPA